MSSSSYLLLPSLTPKTLTLTKSHLSCLPLSSSSLKFFTKPIFASSPFNAPKPLEPTPLSSRFVRNVAVSSEFEQEEDVATEQHFSPDLKLFVGNLPFNVDSSALANLFESAGTVEMVEVIYDKLTGRSRGFGFVTMSTVQEVEAAAQQFDGYEFQGRPLRVNFGPPPPRREESFRGPRVGGGGGSSNSDSSNRLYVGNLSWGVDDSALENLFSEQGKVMEARVVYDRETGRSRGFGFVTYSSPEEVNSAIESLDGVELNGRSIRVTVAESKPRRQF